MVPAIEQKVAIDEYFTSNNNKDVVNDQQMAVKNENQGKNTEKIPQTVVSKDFILSLLSLAIGKPFFLDPGLGQKIDVKI